MRKYLSWLIVIAILVSCTDKGDLDISINDAPTMVSYKVSPEEAKDVLSDFLSSLYGDGTKSGAEKQLTSVHALRNDCLTKSEEEGEEAYEDIDIDTLMYAINFADNQGFALVAADRRTEPILAVIDDGSFDIDSLREDVDEGFLMFVANAVEMEIADIKAYDDSCATKATVTNGYTIKSEYKPLLHTKWAQGDVYGKYCPNGTAGCVVIATAQILSYYQTLDAVMWSSDGSSGAADLHWSRIISDCDNHNGQLTSPACSTSANEVAHLARYLGIALKATYNSDSTTSAASKKAINWFNDYGGLDASSLKDYSESKIISAIKSGYLVYGRGYSKKRKVLGIRVGWKGGHAWVYDGTLIATKNGASSNFVHCNWGWGGLKNGYYLSKAFDTNAGATIYDTADPQNKKTSNYKYNLDYSIVKK